jgi:hypothetical protein
VQLCCTGLVISAYIGIGSASGTFVGTTATGNSFGAASVGAGGQPTATVVGRDVSLSWAAAANADSYAVARSNQASQSLSTTLHGTCASAVAATSCSDTGLPLNGSSASGWTYAVTPSRGSWTGATSPSSATASVPAPTLSTSASSFTTSGGSATATIARFFDDEAVSYCVDQSVTPCGGNELATSTVPHSGGGQSTALAIPAGLSVGAHTIYAVGSNGSLPSAAVTVAAGPSTALSFDVQPGSSYQTASSIAVTVAAVDAYGNVATADSSTVVTLAIHTNPGGGTLTCSNAGGATVTVSSGRADFTCSINQAGSGYTLQATSGSLTSATSSSFDVTSPTLGYSAVGASSTRTSSGSMNVSFPSGTNQNDLVLLVEVNAANQAITTPTGWTLLADQQTSSPSQFRFTVWWKLAASAESTVSLSVHTNASGANAWVVRYTRPAGYPPNPSAAAVAVREGLGSASSSLTPSPDLTTSQADATVISIVAVRSGNTLSLGTPASFAVEANPTQTATGQAVALGIADRLVASSGTSVTSPTWSQSGTAAQWAWATVAFA